MPEDKAAARGWRVVVVYTFVFTTNLYKSEQTFTAVFNKACGKDEIPGVTNKSMLVAFPDSD